MARILLIDDDDAVRDILQLALARDGPVIEAHNGEERLKLLPDANADLLIIGIVMPDKEGLEVLMSCGETIRR
jgi:DNA-binding response OmpR family regulator